jgi:HEPN domain-containing protein
LARGKTPLHDGVCFHCQQCVEKYLKGLLEELAHPIPKIHDLDVILDRVEPNYSSLKSIRRGMSFLTQFSVAMRYPGFDATRRQVKAALRWMERVRKDARRLLAI